MFRRLVIIVFSIIVVQGCTFLTSNESATENIQLLLTKENILSSSLTFKGIPLHSGQIVLSESGNRFSLFFSILTETFSSHIHAGILIFDKGKPYVYEALGSVGLFLGENPTDNISGYVRRRSLNQYILNENYTSIYNLPEYINKQKVIEIALDYYQKKIPFDPYTNTDDHESVYCTEFVAIALEAENKVKIRLTPYRKNKSIKKIRNWLKLVSGGVILADSLVQPENHVVTFSSRLSLRELKLYIFIRYELHRRFIENQRLGNVFEWTGRHLNLRPSVLSFKEKALSLFVNDPNIPSWETVHLSVGHLANKMLGYFPGNDNDTLQNLNLLNYRFK